MARGGRHSAYNVNFNGDPMRLLFRRLAESAMNSMTPSIRSRGLRQAPIRFRTSPDNSGDRFCGGPSRQWAARSAAARRPHRNGHRGSWSVVLVGGQTAITIAVYRHESVRSVGPAATIIRSYRRRRIG